MLKCRGRETFFVSDAFMCASRTFYQKAGDEWVLFAREGDYCFFSSTANSCQESDFWSGVGGIRV